MASAAGQAQLRALDAPAPQLSPDLDPLRTPYALSPYQCFKALLRRDYTFMKRNSFLYM